MSLGLLNLEFQNQQILISLGTIFLVNLVDRSLMTGSLFSLVVYVFVNHFIHFSSWGAKVYKNSKYWSNEKINSFRPEFLLPFGIWQPNSILVMLSQYCDNRLAVSIYGPYGQLLYVVKSKVPGRK
jgi:hypothetical protein